MKESPPRRLAGSGVGDYPAGILHHAERGARPVRVQHFRRLLDVRQEPARELAHDHWLLHPLVRRWAVAIIRDTLRPELERIKTELKALQALKIHVGIQGDADSYLLMIAGVHEYGATIRAKNVKNLAIPISREAEGKSPRDFQGLFFITSEEGHLFGVTPEGDQILAEGRTENMPSFLGTVTASEKVGGDTAVLYCLDSDNGGFGTMLYRLTESELVPIADTANLGLGDLVNCDMTGAYLTGNVLQVYRPNDGYYDINLTTGAQTKTMDVQMEDSWGWHLTDQYILESPLLFNRPEQRLEISAGPHSMLLYDGETWKSVTLPAEIAQISGTNRLFPNCVTSDRVIFTFDDYDNYKTNWYYLILDQENPELVPMCSIEFDI